MADHPDAQTARAAMEAFSKGDMPTFTASLSDDVVWHAPGANRFSGTFNGKGDVMARFKEQAESGAALTFDDIHDIVANDEHVVAMLTLRLTKGDDVLTTPSVFVMHIRDGKLAEFWGMNERQAELDALLG